MKFQFAIQLLTLAAAVAASAAAWMALIANRRMLASESRTKRRKLFDAIYYHILVTGDFLLEQPANNDKIRRRISERPDYTPYPAGSSADDLTYDLVIELLEVLDLTDGDARIVLAYFHFQSIYHEIMARFDSDYVRSWTTERKLEMWDASVEYQAKTLAAARQAREVLERRSPKLRRMWGARPHAAR